MLDAMIAKRQADQASYIVPTLLTSQTPASAPLSREAPLLFGTAALAQGPSGHV
jgi:hypothetical protein